MSKYTNSMSPHRRRAALVRLYHLHNGQCTRCGCAVRMVWEALRDGWTDTGTHVVSPDKTTSIRHATIEHIKARSKGGGDNSENLTLFCSVCNSDTNPSPRFNPRVKMVRHAGPKIAKFSQMTISLRPLTESKPEGVE